MTAGEAPARSIAQCGAAAVLTAFGIAAAVAASRLPFGTVTRPGAGFVPLCLAVALALAGAGLLLVSLRGRAAGEAAGEPARPDGRRRAGATMAALLVHALVFETVGFEVSTFLLIAFLFRAIEPRPWPAALGGAAATVAVCHVLFRTWLGVKLP